MSGQMVSGTSNGSKFQKLRHYSTQKKEKVLDYATKKKEKALDYATEKVLNYVRKHRQKLLVDDDVRKDIDGLPPRRPRRFNDKPGQASTDVPEIVQPSPSKGQVSTDVPEEPLDFSKWVNDMDAAADQVDIHKEEATWNQQSTGQTSFPRSLTIDPYTPQMISFGPFHHGADHLKKYEEHKRRALAHFLHQANMKAELFVSKLRGILKQLQDTYQGLDEKWKKNPSKFLKMMLLDGCFMIEVLRPNESSYAPNDPVFSSQSKTRYKPIIKRDMLSLENQFPLLVLKELLEVENLGRTDDEYINNLVLSYCSDYLRESIPRLASHPLKLYRMSRLGEDTNHTIVQIKTPTFSMTKAIENAVKLKEIGVHFRESQSTSLRGINFDRKTGWLELPVFPVDDETEHVLLNLIGYEKYGDGNVGNEIMSYIKFLYELIHTEDDVKLLQENGIIRNPLRSKDITDLFNNILGKEVVVDPSNDSLSILRSMLSDYYQSKKEKGNFFLQHPKEVLSVVTVTLVLTLIQTIYSMLTFHLRK